MLDYVFGLRSGLVFIWNFTWVIMKEFLGATFIFCPKMLKNKLTFFSLHFFSVLFIYFFSFFHFFFF